MKVSAFVDDVRGFTSISESYKHDPQGLTQLMNRFLTPLTNAIIARKGAIDKYMGDAIMAFWNAPLDDREHQRNACSAAVDMLERIEELNREREEEAKNGGHVYIPLNVGVGLNTGICVVGNPEQCAATLQQFIDAGCHSFCLSGYLHDEEAERFGRLIRPLLAQHNAGRMAA